MNEKLAKNISFWFLVNFSFDSDSTNSSRLCETSLWSLQPVLENFSLLFNSNANGWCAVWLYFTNLFLFDKFSLLSLKWFWASASLFLTQFVNIWNFKKDWIYGCNFLETNIFFLQSCFFTEEIFLWKKDHFKKIFFYWIDKSSTNLLGKKTLRILNPKGRDCLYHFEYKRSKTG